jgi:hypothetical protein
MAAGSSGSSRVNLDLELIFLQVIKFLISDLFEISLMCKMGTGYWVK